MAEWNSVRGKRVLVITCFLTPHLFDSSINCFKSAVHADATLFVVVPTDKDGAIIREAFLKAKLCTEFNFISVDISNPTSAGQRIVDAVNIAQVSVDGVFSVWEHAMPLVGEVSELLGLPGNSKASYCAARNKCTTRALCSNRGLRTPRFSKVNSREDIASAAEKVGFPLVLKPSCGMASDGVYRCDSLPEVYARFDAVQQRLNSTTLLSYNPGCVDSGVLLEEYLPGFEYDIDMVLSQGEVVYSNIVDNWTTVEPTFMETGSNCPSVLPLNEQSELKSYTAECISALGFQQGCFHVEVRYSAPTPFRPQGEPVLVEINPRIGGGRTPLFHKEVYGVDLFQCQFLVACGVPLPSLQNVTEPVCALADYEICAPKTGVVLHERWLDHLKQHPDVICTKTYKRAGTGVLGYDTGIPEWIGMFLVRAEYPEDAIDLIENMLDTIQPPILTEGELRILQQSRKTRRSMSCASESHGAQASTAAAIY
eukprot:comp15830_c0_seq1/m.13136 comp15830_c0_seq1/g.13136  ORF comp15830_c0_seq1/g.13136 comp15830_c0_seq1/m.13136 type:complete len:482 (-) comp15830_c0_seq1:21-1466(-)